MKRFDDTAKHLDAARAVLDRCGGPGAVDGMTRTARRDALIRAREEVVELAAAIHGAERKEARALGDEIQKRIDALGKGPIARRRRPLIIRKVIPMVVAIVALSDRCAAVYRKDAEGSALRALFYFLIEWLEAWWDVDDYIAAGFACRVKTAPRLAWFSSATAERRAADLEAEKADESARSVENHRRTWVEKARIDDEARPILERLERVRGRVNATHKLVSEANPPFPDPQLSNAWRETLIEDATGHLQLIDATLAAAASSPDLLGEVVVIRAALERVRADYGEALASLEVPCHA